jgi:hypothetical protein
VARESAVSAEASSRVLGDSSLASGLSSEVSRAESAEGSLATTIANVISNADPAALDSLVEIVNAFQSADGDLNGTITSLATDLSSDISTEVDARMSADFSLESNLTNYISNEYYGPMQTLYREISDRVYMDQSLATDLSTEISRAQEAETSLETALSTEVSYLIANTDLTAIDSFAEVSATIEHTYHQVLPLWYDEANPLPISLNYGVNFNQIDGSNPVFVTQTPIKVNSENIYLNGMLLTRGKDYNTAYMPHQMSIIDNQLNGVNTFAFRFLFTSPQPGDTITIYGVYDNRMLP